MSKIIFQTFQEASEPVLLVTKKRPDVLNICFSGVDNDV